MKRMAFVIGMLLCATLAVCQFNDTTHFQVAYAATGIFNKTSAGTSRVFSNTLKFATRLNSGSLNSASSWIYGWQNEKRTNNDWTSTLDFNLYKTAPHFYYWGLANYQKSFSLKINNQWQAGVGVAYSVVDRETAYLNISNGLLYEASSLQLNDSTKEVYNTFRNSLRLRYRFAASNGVSLQGTHFWQPALSGQTDYILKTDMTLSVKLKQWLAVTAAVTYNKLSRTQRENLLITFGLTAERFF